MLMLVPFAAIYTYFSSAMPRSGGEYIYVSRVLWPFLGFIASWTLTIVGLNWQGNNTNFVINWGLDTRSCNWVSSANNPTLLAIGTELQKTQGFNLGLAVRNDLPVSVVLRHLPGHEGFHALCLGSHDHDLVMLAVYAIVLLRVNPEIVAENMQKLQGISYTGVLEQAKSLGWQPGFTRLWRQSWQV